MKQVYILIATLLLSTSLLASVFKMRAREHYSTHKVYIGSNKGEYTGFSPSINLWWEDPYKISYGFVLKPGFGKYSKDDSSSLLLDKFRLFKLGGELKYFPDLIIDQLFFRAGFGASALTSNNHDDVFGTHIYAGIGLEIPISNFGLAVEVAYQYTSLEQNIKITTFMPSIGFHFYKLL